WSKLAGFARDNPIAYLDHASRLHVREGAVFVFGGDAIDRGPEARRVVATLLEAQRRMPDRVVLLAGNRDINKLRLVRELSGSPPPGAPRTADRGELLRWIFSRTMGARDAFEHRRAEIGGSAASDAEVVASFLEDLAPGGALRDYLAV